MGTNEQIQEEQVVDADDQSTAESNNDRVERLSKAGDVLGLLKVLPEMSLDVVSDVKLMSYIKTALHNSGNNPDKQHIVVLDGVIDFFTRVTLFIQNRMDHDNYTFSVNKPLNYTAVERIPAGFSDYQMMLNCLITIMEKRAKLMHLSNLGKKSRSRKNTKNVEDDFFNEDMPESSEAVTH